MYSVEYKWTKHETKVTTINIIPVKLSNKKPQDTENKSESIHGKNKRWQFPPDKITSKKATKHKTKVVIKHITVKIAAPELPIKKPKSPAPIELNNGKNTSVKYITPFTFF